MRHLLPLAILTLAACNGEDPDDPNEGGPTVPWDITVTDILDQPVPGAQVCYDGDCQTLDANNSVVVDVAAESQVVVTIEADDFVNMLYSMEIGADSPDAYVVTMVQQAVAELALEDAGVTVDSTPLGAMAFGATVAGQGGVEGISATLSPNAGDGPFYANASQLGVEVGATGTTTSGGGRR